MGIRINKMMTKLYIKYCYCLIALQKTFNHLYEKNSTSFSATNLYCRF